MDLQTLLAQIPLGLVDETHLGIPVEDLVGVIVIALHPDQDVYEPVPAGQLLRHTPVLLDDPSGDDRIKVEIPAAHRLGRLVLIRSEEALDIDLRGLEAVIIRELHAVQETSGRHRELVVVVLHRADNEIAEKRHSR